MIGRPCKPNAFERRGQTVCIWLTDKDGGLRECLVDAADFHIVSSRRWCVKLATPTPKTAYAQSGTRPIKPQKPWLMHRLILGVTDGNVEIDHINGNGLDNRRVNLRIATTQFNTFNRRGPNINSKTGYRNVGQLKDGKYRVRVHYGKMRFEQQGFATPQEANEVAIAVRTQFLQMIESRAD